MMIRPAALIALILALTLPGCAAVEGIFEAGMAVGVIIAVVVVVIIGVMIAKLRR